MIEGNERRPFYRIILQGNGSGNGQNSRVLCVNESRLNENFKIIDDELRRLWNKGIDSLSVRMTSDEQMFITAEDAEVIAVYQIENSALIAALPDTIMLQVQGVLTDYSTTVQMNSAIQQSAGSITSMVSQTYETIADAAGKVGSNEIISKINQTSEQITIDANKVNLTGYITATNLSTAGQTTINGGNITTGSISANRISGGTLTLGGQNNTNGTLVIKDANGNAVGWLNNDGFRNDGQNARVSISNGGLNATDLNGTVCASVRYDYSNSEGIIATYGADGYVQISGDVIDIVDSNTNDVATLDHSSLKSLLGILQYGDAIPSNADLDDYTTPGVWYAYLTQAQSASNCPVNTAFKLIVMRLFPVGRYYQILMAAGTAAPDIYLRFYNDDTDTFSAWKKLSMTNV